MNVRLRLSWILAWWLTVGLAASYCCAAQEVGLSAKHHPWGRFKPGAWKMVRVVTETLDEQGVATSTSITETKTSLVKVDEDGVLLEVEVGIEVAGKQFDGQPQCIKQGFHGELAGPDVKVKRSGTSQITIEDRKVDCHFQQLDLSGPSGRTSMTVYYSDALMPYVLKRDSTTTDVEGKNVLGATTLEVVALDMPQRVVSEIQRSAYIKTVQKSVKGTITTLAITSGDVPGGVVYTASKETDKNGRVVRRSTLELVGYGLQVEEERLNLFGRKRPSRVRKPPR